MNSGTPCSGSPHGPGKPRSGNSARHPLEDILSNSLVRKALGLICDPGPKNDSWLERFSRTYHNPELSTYQRWWWFLPHLAADLAIKKAGLDRDLLLHKLFHHQPTVRALALTGRSIARYGLHAPQRFDAPLMVVWNFTQLCNLRCQHCYQNATARALADELTLEQKLDVIDQLSIAGVPFLAFAGGEPLASKDLLPVLEHAKKRKIYTIIATNGTLLTPEMARRLAEAGVKYVEVSIDSPDPRQHDSFRGMPGAWNRSVQGIRNVVEAGMRAGLATFFTRHNYTRVDEVIELAISLGCKTFSHFNFIPVGRATNVAQDDLTPEQREWLLRKLVAHLQEGRINIISTAPQFGRACVAYAPPEGIFATGHAGSGAGSKTMVLSRYVGGCGAGRCYCSIQPNGDVTPCVYMPNLRVGSLKTTSFRQIWDCELFALLSDRADRSGHCAVCKDRAYCGGCRARALAYTGDLRASDPGCVRNRKLWEQVTAAGAAVAAS